MNIIVLRTQYHGQATSGIMLIDEKFFGYTLEDKIRIGKKIPGETAIPSGRYELALTMSETFGRVMPELLNVYNFTGIRIHGGNTVADTAGCILVAKRRVSEVSVYQSLEKELTAILETAPGKNWIEIINCWPYISVDAT